MGKGPFNRVEPTSEKKLLERSSSNDTISYHHRKVNSVTSDDTLVAKYDSISYGSSGPAKHYDPGHAKESMSPLQYEIKSKLYHGLIIIIKEI